MTLPKHRNIRKITVDDVSYYWTIQYDEDYGLITCTIGLVNQPNIRFSFTRGASDAHVRFIQNHVEEKDELTAITPKLVAEAITFVNKKLDWKNTSVSKIVSDSTGFRVIDEEIFTTDK